MQTLIVTALVGLVGVGCSSPYRMVNGIRPDPERYELLGEGEGRASGWVVLHFLPVGMRDSLERAVQGAVESRRGDDLAEVQVQHRWYWTPLWQGYGYRVRGEVVRELTADERSERLRSREPKPAGL